MTTWSTEPAAKDAAAPGAASPADASNAVSADARPWLRLSIVTAALSAVGSVIALLNVQRIYGAEVEIFIQQAIAQDIVNLLVVAPLTVALAIAALRGSLAAYLLWLGAVAFTVYNYVIYAFTIHFGPLFLLWVAVLGASLITLVAGAVALDATRVAEAMHFRRHRFAAGLLMFAAAAFGLMWLSVIVPSLFTGGTPDSVQELATPTNPVHVLDLAFLLPAAALAGWSLWHRRPLGYVAAPPLLVLMALTGLPIIATAFVAAARGEAAAWPLLAPIGVLTVLCATRALATVRTTGPTESIAFRNSIRLASARMTGDAHADECTPRRHRCGGRPRRAAGGA